VRGIGFTPMRCATSAHTLTVAAWYADATCLGSGRTLYWRRYAARVLEAERSALLRLRDSGAINDEVRRRIERELDLQDAWLEA
jgi:hypothetical protein